MLTMLRKKHRETDCCRYCKFAHQTGEDTCTCKYKGEVEPSEVCRRYRFNPFAHRVPRLRSIDTTMFDPLDFDMESE